jgi:hypothetical protein
MSVAGWCGALISTVGLAACGTARPSQSGTAPPPSQMDPRQWSALRTSDVAIARAASRLVTVVEQSDLDPSDYYRCFVVAGFRGESAAGLMSAELNALRAHRWKLSSSIRLVGPRAITKRAPVGARGAIVTVNGPANHEYVAMSYATSISDINQQISDSPLDTHGKEIRAAFRSHRPVLIITSARKA